MGNKYTFTICRNNQDGEPMVGFLQKYSEDDERENNVIQEEGAEEEKVANDRKKKTGKKPKNVE